MAKKYLMDVVLIRLTLIFLLVFYHAFCPFTSGWTPVPAEDFHIIEAYRLLGVLSHNFQLEAMVFISGLLFGYALTLYPERLTFRNCILKKAKRILLPGLLFSLLYYAMFFDLRAPWYFMVHKLLNGCGHLWFLPMIFWCFVTCYLLERRPKNTPPHCAAKIILGLSAMAVFVPFGIPFLGLGRLPEFFSYFYLGFAMKRGYIRFPMIQRRWGLLGLLLVYVTLCVGREMMFEYWPKPEALVEVGVRSLLSRASLLLCALSMIVFLYSVANRPRIKAWLERRPWLITLSGYCYGVYIYQQFILKYLYYDTPFASWLPTEVFPWVGFVGALVLSLALCHLTLKTRWGRYLIG